MPGFFADSHRRRGGWAGETCSCGNRCAPNGPEVNPRGRALVAMAARHAACLHVKSAMQAAWRREFLIFGAGSAGGPKPGRAGFYLELGRW